MGLKYYLRGLGVGIVVTALIMGIATNVQKEKLTDAEIKERARALGMVEESPVLADSLAQGAENPGSGGQEDAAALPTATGGEQDEADFVPEDEETAPGGLTPDTSADPEEGSTPSASPAKSAEATPLETTTPSATATPKATAVKEPTPVPTATPQKKEAEKTPDATPKESATPKASETPTPSATPTPTASPKADQDESQEQGGSVSIHVEGGSSSITVCKKLEQAGLVSSASGFDTYLCQNGYDKKIRAGSFEIPMGASQEEIAKIITKTN